MEPETTWKNIHEEIVDACLKGDRTAHERLYNLYSRAMYNAALRITGNGPDAEDVLQESFVSAFRNLHSWNRTATFGAWLKRIVVNRSINLLRKRKVHLESIDGKVDRLETEDGKGTADWEERHLKVEKIRKALAELPDGYRSVFSLYALEGYDHKEIAEILGITESTSKSQYNRSKKKLRELIEEHYGEG